MTYQTTCAEVIHRYDGHIAQYLGDGITRLFWLPCCPRRCPTCHSRRLRHAVSSCRPQPPSRTVLRRPSAAPCGYSPGLVVVGEVGGGPQHGQLALGVTPNIAAKLQAMATPESVVISDATHGLVQGYFVCRTWVNIRCQGWRRPSRCIRSCMPATREDAEAAARRGLTPLVGRDIEIALPPGALGPGAAGQWPG